MASPPRPRPAPHVQHQSSAPTVQAQHGRAHGRVVAALLYDEADVLVGLRGNLTVTRGLGKVAMAVMAMMAMTFDRWPCSPSRRRLHADAQPRQRTPRRTAGTPAGSGALCLEGDRLEDVAVERLSSRLAGGAGPMALSAPAEGPHPRPRGRPAAAKQEVWAKMPTDAAETTTMALALPEATSSRCSRCSN